MAPAIASTVVDRPAAELFAYATDPASFPEWQQGVIDGHLDRHGPGWQSVSDGVDGDQGWPLYLARYAALLEDR